MHEQELWQIVLTDIEEQISKANFVTWFKNTYISSKKDGVVSVAVPNGFSKEWLEKKYNKYILKSLRNNANEVKDVKYVIENKKPSVQVAENTKQQRKKDEDDTQLQFEELQIDKNTNLNPKYTFDSFVVGASNELAHAAALSVVNNPGTTYNPLFIYGGVGLGKTHLLQAIGNELSKNKRSVVYLTSEQFTSEFISAVQNQNIESFKNKYRKKDLLIIDDIQFIAGKEGTQEEFFHTFNALHERNKQIILSSDRPPKAIPTLEERLRSRFEGGMLIDIGYPDYETRVAILKIKIKDKNVSLSEEVINYIASHIQKNVRELEGALNLIIASSKLHKNEISLDQAKKVLAHLTQKPKKPITFKKIFKTVTSFYEVDEKDLISKNRKREVVLPRQVAMFLMRTEMKSSYPYIGEKFGGKDHTTVIHACDKIERKLKENSSFEEEFNFIKQQLYLE
ncbi:MAG: chromosomal replication initiator protein DnaA [Candidatus Spechtbacterales bacterium]|nr:chromosomal replication initiator protein DnaA [Candidatus Spechtbacterales bacterium]